MSDAITVLLKGKKEEDVSDQLYSLTTSRGLNQIPEAQLVLATGNFAERIYPLFDLESYAPGESLEIQLRYELEGGKTQTVFSGVITRRSFATRNQLPVLILEAKDPAFALKNAVKTQLFTETNDKKMIEEVLLEADGVSLGKVNTSLSEVKFDQFVRQQMSAWAFIQERAHAHGVFILLDNGTLDLLKLDETNGKISLDVGIDPVLDLELEESIEAMNAKWEVAFWDLKSNQVQTEKVDSSAGQKANAPDCILSNLNLMTKAEAIAVLKAKENYQALHAFSGWVEIPGDASLQPMQELELKGVPSAYPSTTPITWIQHSIEEGKWKTRMGIGKEKDPKKDSPPTCIPPLALQIGTAAEWEKDPQDLGRVPVTIPAFGEETYWVFPAQMCAGTTQRSFFLPDAGEQVVIGFLHQNISQGVILTSLYLPDALPQEPFQLEAASPVGWVLNPTQRFTFDPEKKEALWEMEGNQILLSDAKGIEAESAQDMQLNSEGKMNLKASQTTNIKAQTINLN